MLTHVVLVAFTGIAIISWAIITYFLAHFLQALKDKYCMRRREEEANNQELWND